ncbi:hypothetical protein PS1_038898 [Malus domestica]
MKEDLTLADSFAMVEKHALWDEARQCIFKDLKKYSTSLSYYPNRKQQRTHSHSGPIPAVEHLLLHVTWPQLHGSLPCLYA